MYKKNPNKFKEIEHTADIGIVCFGNTLAELFGNAAFGMYQLLMEDVEISTSIKKKIQIKERTLPDLLVAWLSELNYLFVVHNFIACVFNKIHVKQNLEHWHLEAVLLGDKNNIYKEYCRTEIKAVTYHQLKIEQSAELFTSRIFFDI